MDLISGYPFWPAKNGFIHTYDPLDQDLTCDVLVLGGGITGAVIAHDLQAAGYQTVVLDRRNFGWGSTCGSTALLMYEIDTHLIDLAKRIGISDAATAYRAGIGAIEKARRLCEQLGAGDFVPRESVYFAPNASEAEELHAEFLARKTAGFDVEWLSAADFSEVFDFPAGGAIRTRQAADLDAYLLTHRLLARAKEQGARLYARTEAIECAETDRGVQVKTDRGPAVAAQFVVIACGYESLKYLRTSLPVALHSSYALASEPIRDFSGWPNRCLLWESRRPYIYVRTTADGRGIIGGEDIPFQNDQLRDALLTQKVARLEARWKELFPRIPLETAFPWTGTFAESADGLPYIGFGPEQPRAFFAMSYGGNGITFSMIAADMLLAALKVERHPCADVFSLERR
jgi:glycine/D-amino acid oxidase-like deaminating enzyme